MMLLPAAAAGAVWTAPAGAAVNLELGLAIDGSGSMTSAQFNLQKLAYLNVLADVIPLDGSVAIGVKRFATSVTNVFTTRVIAGQSDLDALLAAISFMPFTGGGTNIAGAITAFTNEIMGNGIDSQRQLIDVSTDGLNNIGNLNVARLYAINAGIDAVNCIGIGIGARCDLVQAGETSFSLHATDFDTFEVALRRKIVTEVEGVIPEPGTWAMMIGGFALAGAAMRRRKVSVRFA